VVTITYIANNTAPHLKFPVNFTVGEDSSLEVDLFKYIIDSTNTIGEMTWQFAQGPHLAVQFDPNTFKLQIIPEPDWYGSSYVDITATDPFNLFDQERVNITVENRNDLQNFTIRASGKNEVTFDIQTELPSLLDISYWYNTYQIITVSMVSFQIRHTVTLTNLLPDTTYHFKVKLTDESGKSLTIQDSTFRTGSASVSLASEDVIVYPNPIKPSEGQNEMIFVNLPEETSKIILYSVLGEKIYEEEVTGANQREYRINIAKNTRAQLPTGLYIYMVKSSTSRVLKSGKIVIIR